MTRNLGRHGTAEVGVRTATLADLDPLETLETRVFDSDELSRRSLRYYIGAATAVFLVLEAGDTIVGDAIVAFRRNARVARLYSVAIHPDHVGQGHGKRLLVACEEAAKDRRARALRLEVRADNAPAIRLYRRAGYREFGRYDNYYEDGAVALRFEKSFPSAASDGSGHAEP